MNAADVPQGWAIVDLDTGQRVGGKVLLVVSDGREEVHVSTATSHTIIPLRVISALRSCTEAEALSLDVARARHTPLFVDPEWKGP